MQRFLIGSAFAVAMTVVPIASADSRIASADSRAATPNASRGANASPNGASPIGEKLAFVDGGHAIVATRVEGTSLSSRGELLQRVRIDHGNGRVVDAGVGRGAIVRLAPGAKPAGFGLRWQKAIAPSLGLWLVEDEHGHRDGLRVAADLSTPLATQAGIVEATPDLHFKMRRKDGPYTPNDPRFGGQWYFQNLEMPNAWGLSRGDAGTTIVIIDTGCDITHVDLASKMDAGRDVVDGDDDPTADPSEEGASHGTACAGLAAAATDNDEGIAGGCPDCRLRCVRFLSDHAVPLSADVEAFQFALDVDADVVSNSWGFVDPMPAPKALVDIIHEVYTKGRGGKGAMVLFAAGNDDRELGDDEIENAEGVLCVGAINNFDESTPFTNRGNAVDIVAPTGTLTTDLSGPAGSDPTDYQSLFGGTSSACPVAAGVAGLMVSAAPDKTAAELYASIIETTRPAPFANPEPNGHDDIYGYGIIWPEAALRNAMGLPPLPGEGGGGSDASGTTTGGEGGAGGAADGGADDSGCGCAIVGEPATSEERTAALAIAMVGFAALVGARRNRRR